MSDAVLKNEEDVSPEASEFLSVPQGNTSAHFHVDVSVRIRVTDDTIEELLPMTIFPSETGKASLIVEKTAPSSSTSFSGRLGSKPAGGSTSSSKSNKADGNNKTYKGFASILNPSIKNYEVYKAILEPLVQRVLYHQETACCFAYGHTGSGKTHTIIGYGDEELGLYRYAVNALTEGIKEYGKGELQVQIRCAELYQGKVFDLLSDTHHEECFIREDSDGQIHIRGATQVDSETGCVRVHSLHAAYAKSSDDVITLVQTALSNRIVGNSSLHSQSSRSHAIIELQLVTPDVIAAREALLEAEARLVPIGKAKDGMYISVMSRCYKPDPDKKGAYIEDRSNVPASDFEELERLKQEVEKAEQVVRLAKEQEQLAVLAAVTLLPRLNGSDIAEIPQDVQSGRKECPTLVLVDLAGAEYSAAPATGKGTNGMPVPVRSAQDISEAKEINTSLLALKECMRALANDSKHVPYRNSKLTMLLRRYLRSESASAAMIATITPSKSQANATMNTLQYATLLTTDAGGNSNRS